MIELLAQTSNEPSGAAAAAIAAGVIVYLIILLAIIAFTTFCHWVVAKKAGYNPWLSLLTLVPVVNFIVYLIFVFGEWPIQRELRELRVRAGIPPGGYPPPSPGYPPHPELPPSGVPPMNPTT